MSKKLLGAILILCLVFVFSSCGAPEFTVDDIKAELPALIDASKPLNEIYFGKGFEINGDGSVVGAFGGYYYCDCEEYGLFSVADIKEATEKVFTKEYAEILYLSAFEGISTDTAVEAPKYSEGELGLMQAVNVDVYELPERIYDYNSIEIIKNKGDRVTFSIATTADGVSVDLEMILVRYVDEDSPETTNAEGKKVPSYIYRLDSPTY